MEASEFVVQIEVGSEGDDFVNYLMKVDSESIAICVTEAASRVEQWIRETEEYNHLRLHRLLVAIDINRPKNTVSVKTVEILKICVNKRVLIFRIRNSDSVPDALTRFFKNPKYTFIGVSIDIVKQLLFSEYSLEMMKTMDLAEKAGYELCCDISQFGWKELAELILDKYIDPERVNAVNSSDWDRKRLSEEQVMYLSLIAYGSFLMARKLESWY